MINLNYLFILLFVIAISIIIYFGWSLNKYKQIVKDVELIKIKEISTKEGRGIFALKKFSKGDLIEAAPYLEVDKECNKGILSDYTFQSSNKDKMIIGLGYFSLYNHDDNNNAEYVYSGDGSRINIIAIRDILPGEEIYINYGNQWWEQRPNIQKK